ncbi:MAG TPA: hypothetical protein H9756_07800, partial [Candidatus Mediterraneibacter gallistercoris]|nr:hypothetical protein [Candidatus Mediterraneibacter gallistercoris]
ARTDRRGGAVFGAAAFYFAPAPLYSHSSRWSSGRWHSLRSCSTSLPTNSVAGWCRSSFGDA